MIFEITFIISSLFQTYIYYLFSACFYRKKAEPKRVFGGCSIFFAVTTIAYLIFNVPVLNFISVVICAFINCTCDSYDCIVGISTSNKGFANVTNNGYQS